MRNDELVKIDLSQPLTLVKGVGEERAKDLTLLGIHTLEDLLYYFPYRYEDNRVISIEEASHDERITIEGTVHSEAVTSFFGRKKSRTNFKLYVPPVLITATLFNRPYAKNHFKIGQKIRVSGKWDRHRMQLTVSEYTLIKEDSKYEDTEQSEIIKPVYSLTGSITIKFMQKIIQQALKQFGNQIPEILPEKFVQAYKLISRKDAIQALHFPTTFEAGKWARRRMVYEEFFLFQLKMNALKKMRRENHQGVAQAVDHSKLESFIEELPFSLTGAQKKVLGEIIRDLQKPYAMNRLLQGDVGSGKTVIAAIALYATYTAGFQGALMVPTEILAEQHYHSLSHFFAGKGIEIALLTGSTKQSERKIILAGLQMGTIHLLVGTHTLIQDHVIFQNIGLVIIDEQHRFGVEQRRKLRNKGESPDVLFMTATPIPRTLAITAYGDLDVSIVDELPAGRKPIETYWATGNMFGRVSEFLKKELMKGRQAYFICPLIEESEKLDLQNAIELHATLSGMMPEYKVGLMHGKLSSQEKEEVMKQFQDNKIQLLVSTTVIEVGVNVPNATIMVIQDAERFGLSQLHQLRGRVGRGEHQSYCILISDPKTESGKERMKIMQETNDGFEIAKRDLELRGPGDFFGKKQSGLPEFKVADMVHDYRALEVARQDASSLIEDERFWTDPSYELLRQYLKKQGVVQSEKLD